MCVFFYFGEIHAAQPGIKISFPTFDNNGMNETEYGEFTTKGFVEFYDDAESSDLSTESDFEMEPTERTSEKLNNDIDNGIFGLATTPGTKLMTVFAILFSILLLIIVCLFALFCLFCFSLGNRVYVTEL